VIRQVTHRIGEGAVVRELFGAEQRISVSRQARRGNGAVAR